jgi:hypothetical protein
MFNEIQLKILTTILNTHCDYKKAIKRYEIFKLFEKQAKSGLELYRFEQLLSKAINDNIITGFKVKIGRNGGVIKTLEEIIITITCSLGTFQGNTNTNELLKFIKKNNIKMRLGI